MYKLLIAEDEDRIREGIKKQVHWLGLGYEIVAEARDGLEAFGKYLKYAPQVILTDLQMPVMNGFDLMRRVRSDNRKVKLVVLSSSKSFNDAQQAINIGVSGFLLKPTTIQELEALFIRLKQDLDKALLKECNPNQFRLDPEMARVIRYLNENFAEKITLQDMADMIYISSPYFGRQFKTQVGMSFTDYLIELRMEKAKELLGSVKPKVIDVALDVGYDDFRYFCKLFKAKMGISPKQYAKCLHS